MKKLNFQIITKDFDLNEETEYLKKIAYVAVKSSADLLQLRNKKISAHGIYNAALFIKKILRSVKSTVRPLLIINDRPDIAYMTGADGVHVGQDDISAAYIKKLFPLMTVGVSAENIEQAIKAEKNGADYIGAGPAYPTNSKPDAGDSMKREVLTEICKAVKIPVIAIGGINTYNIKELAAAGVSGAAVISAVSNAANPLDEALKFRKSIDEYCKK